MARFKVSINKTFLPLVCLFLLSVIILIFWFKAGKLYGGGDIGLPTYNPILLSQVAKHTWWEAQGTGFSYPAVAASYPFYLLLSIPQRLGLNPLGIQILFFGGVIFFSLSGIFLLFYLITKNRLISLLAAIFYLLNPYTMMNVFHRFNHTSMVMLAYLPWTLLFLYLGVTRKKIIFVPTLALSSLVAAYAFGSPAFLATWWFLVITFYIYLIRVEKKIELKYKILFFITLIIFWLGLNLWWLMPFLQTANSVLVTTTTTSGNVNSLRGVSQYFELPFAFRGINSFFVTQQVDWGEIYSNPFFNLVSWIGFGFILISLLAKKISSYFNYFLVLFLITIFVSKGSGGPFGDILVGAFSAFPILGVFRNPFEKFGILLPLFSSILFAYGVEYSWAVLASRFGKMTAKVILTILVGGFFIIYHWPIWTGNLFGNIHSPAFVEVPQEYNQIGQRFNNTETKNSRILHLPLALGDSAVYDWSYGYNGLEISQLFFPGSSISHYLGSELLDRRYEEIAKAVKEKDSVTFQYLLNNFEVNYIVLHQDINFNEYRYDSLAEIKSFLNSLPYIHLKTNLGKLAVYDVSSKPDQDNVYFSAGPTLISGNLSYFDEEFLSQNNLNVFVDGQDPLQAIQRNEDMVFPAAVINYPFAIVSKENAITELLAAKYLPGSLLYNLARVKEELVLLTKNEEEKFLGKLDLTGKRLIEVERLLAKSEPKKAEEHFNEYLSQLESLVPTIKERVKRANFENDIDSLQLYQGILLRHEMVMKANIFPLAKDGFGFKVNSVIINLDHQLAEIGLAPLYPSKLTFPSPTLRFNIIKEGDYDLIFKRENWQALPFSDTKTKLLLDGQEKEIDFGTESKRIKIGPIKFSQGEHEIIPNLGDLEKIKKDQTPVILSNPSLVMRLDGESDGYEMQARSDQTFIEYDLGKVYTDSLYQISFQFWTKAGLTPELSVFEDINRSKKGKLLPSLIKAVPGISYEYYWRTLSLNFKPNRLTDDMRVRISLRPWNNCTIIYKNDPEKCEDKAINKGYNRDSLIQIRNVSVKQIPISGLVLIKDNPTVSTKANYLSNLNRINPTKYSLDLTNNQAGILVLDQSYNDGWTLKNQTGQQLYSKHVLVNGYANGWVLPASSNQQLVVEFSPQTKLYLGIYLGLIILFSGLILVVVIWRRYEKV